MNHAKLLRTAQSYLPFLKPAKDMAYRHLRRVLRTPHEQDFRVLAGLRYAPSEVLIDVGANHGQTIESMRLYQPDIPIVAFEASPRLAAALARRYARSATVRIETSGLGDRAGAFTLYTPSYRGFVYDGLASLDLDEAMGWLGPHTLHGFRSGDLTVTESPCTIATMDSFALAPAFLKIDVQGLEYAVLAGARATIERSRPAILVEDFETDPRIGALMDALGYAIFHVAAGVAVSGPGPGPNTLLLPRDRPRFSVAAA